MINRDLAERLELTEDEIGWVQVLQAGRDYIEAVMSFTDDPDKLKRLFATWTENEYALQEAWGFGKDSSYHKWWNVPKCTCPKIDNDDAYPTGYYVTTSDCPVHGE